MSHADQNTVPQSTNDLFSSGTLDIYLAPSNTRLGKPLARWWVMLAPSNTPPDVKDCSFYHTAAIKDGSRVVYKVICRIHHLPFDHPPLSTKLATPYRLGTVPRFNRVDVLRIVDATVTDVANETQPWPRTFVEKLEEADYVQRGTADWYMRHCEPRTADGLDELVAQMSLSAKESLDELVERLDLEDPREAEESIQEMMGKMGLGDGKGNGM
ncbi:uncharacterized protein DSM5745_04845 [Aspergillus mulundensis]|uniref:Uncharacterized protein n=1 Tax=Aspergillus mulundensis TaxID=1810919 RepID=A0A3D8S4T6_9EURO|nr:hypothetical protein DSM5745_04845 [Aspergillus mulundensis]RDW81288.1 hypothetical protein DSM5745_04845 [Aspergillus mulundensis]